MNGAREEGSELIYKGEVYVLVNSDPIRLMTGFKGGVCGMCQLDELCPTVFRDGLDYCGDGGPLVFVKKLEV